MRSSPEREQADERDVLKVIEDSGLSRNSCRVLALRLFCKKDVLVQTTRLSRGPWMWRKGCSQSRGSSYLPDAPQNCVTALCLFPLFLKCSKTVASWPRRTNHHTNSARTAKIGLTIAKKNSLQQPMLKNSATWSLLHFGSFDFESGQQSSSRLVPVGDVGRQVELTVFPILCCMFLEWLLSLCSTYFLSSAATLSHLTMSDRNPFCSVNSDR